MHFAFFGSEFPGEIIGEIEKMNFELFNTEYGSYQTITPAILHMVHTNKVRHQLENNML